MNIPNFLTRAWLLSKLPMRRVEFSISRKIKDAGYAPILRWLMRHGRMPTQDVGIVDVDVDLGKFFVHELERGAFYLEATYSGMIDVDVKLREDERMLFAGFKTKSFMLGIEAVAQIDVEGKKVTSFEIIDSDIIGK